eukprot:XP_001697288.1 predicted protein [Chlamydomonas reinhardtii]
MTTWVTTVTRRSVKMVGIASMADCRPGDMLARELRALLVTALNAYCTPEVTTPPALLLGSYKGPTLSLAIQPAVCPVQVRLGFMWPGAAPAIPPAFSAGREKS